MAGKKTRKKIKEKKADWETEVVWDIAKFGVDFTKLILTVNRLVNAHVPGQVKISAHTDVSVNGARAASMFGSQSASVSSTVSASLLGGTASVKGVAYTSVWAGIDASMKAFRSVTVEAEAGQAKLTSKSKTEVKCEDGPVMIQGNSSVQMAAKTLGVGIYGEDCVWMGSGDAGYAVSFTPTDVTLAKLSSGGKTFRDSSFDGSQHLTLNSQGWELKFSDSVLSMNGSAVGLKASKLDLGAASGNIEIKANGRILVGG
jgi:hypothetical protein